jgi:hypothetical protein
VLKLVPATLCVVFLGACTDVTGSGRTALVRTASIVGPEACYVRNTVGELWQVQCGEAVLTAKACYVSSGAWDLQEIGCPRGRLQAVVKRRAEMQEE